MGVEDNEIKQEYRYSRADPHEGDWQSERFLAEEEGKEAGQTENQENGL